MAGRVAGKVVIVTGAASGIGKGIAWRLCAEGARVVVADRDGAAGQAAAAGAPGPGAAEALSLDQASEESCRDLVRAVVARHGRLDGLVNNAGMYPRATLEETTREFWDTVMDVNLRGVFLLCREALPHMVAGGGGSIVNIGSVHADAGSSNLTAYAVSKGGLVTLTVHIARSYARHRVRANVINPGWVATEGEIRTQHSQGLDAGWLMEQGSKRPMGRHQTPEDIGHAALFLLSDESTQLTGSQLNVDGGLRLYPAAQIAVRDAQAANAAGATAAADE